ncbi:MAG: hypothetical protein QOJ50_875 [Cryptosporangiaceae bacterium]|nr:hypothetical protein [Cryptosporangiaceae bacterium]
MSTTHPTAWLRTYRARRRSAQDLSGLRAQARLRADESAVTGQHRRSVPLGGAWRAFWRHPSPWMLAAFLAGALSARLVAGSWSPGDAVLPILMIAVFPLFEWAVHVCVLHWRPRQLGRRTIDPLLARRHRAHHADPRDIPLVFIPWRALPWIIASYVAAALLAFPRLGLALTFLTVLAALGLGYEWAHYLIHSDYRPRSSVYRAVWRNHRLHHYKNEHYWFTVTTAGTADRVFGTCPDAQDIATSPTVRDLHARESSRTPHG